MTPAGLRDPQAPPLMFSISDFKSLSGLRTLNGKNHAISSGEGRLPRPERFDRCRSPRRLGVRKIWSIGRTMPDYELST